MAVCSFINIYVWLPWLNRNRRKNSSWQIFCWRISLLGHVMMNYFHWTVWGSGDRSDSAGNDNTLVNRTLPPLRLCILRLFTYTGNYLKKKKKKMPWGYFPCVLTSLQIFTAVCLWDYGFELFYYNRSVIVVHFQV